MSKKPIVQEFEKKHLKSELPDFRVGDTVRVHTRIIEGNKERVQVFMGTVIARKGSGLSETFSVHRVAYGEGMERVFLLNSPRIAKIEIVSHGDVRRGKLYHLRGTHGKKAKVKSLVGGRALQNNGEKPQDDNSQEEAEVNNNEFVAEETEAVVNDNDESAANNESLEEETEKADA